MPASLPLHGPVAEVAAVPQPPPTPEPLIDGMTAEAREKFAARNDDPIAAYLAINRYIERVIGPGVQSVRRAATMPEDSDSHPAPATSTSGPPTLPPAAVPPNPTPSPFQTAQYQTCAEFIAENCKASILRVFPGQFLDVPVDDVLDAAKQGDRAAQTAKKLLFENRFRK
jgi:hypothetical protein